MNSQPTVFVVDPDPSTQEAVRNLVGTLDVLCEPYVSGQDFLAALDRSHSGCLVLELRAPGVNGLQVQQALNEEASTLPVIFLSTNSSVSIAVHAMRAGALHFLEKPIRENDLWNALEEGLQVDQQRRAQRRRQQDAEQRLTQLTEKEHAILDMLCEGQTKGSIAEQLGISVRTVEHHRTQLMRKLNTNSLAGLLSITVLAGRRTGNSGHHLAAHLPHHGFLVAGNR